MYNILLVDDEFLARNQLQFLLDWKKHGYFFAGEANCATEAIDILKHQKIDLVFTDINMPDMNGIELVNHINENYPDISIVVLSNYSDFDYVRGVISANVIDYVLKYKLSVDVMLNILQKFEKKRQQNDCSSHFLTSVESEFKYRTLVKHSLIQKDFSFHSDHTLIAIMEIQNHKLNMQRYSKSEQEILFQNIENTIAKIVTNINHFVIFNDGPYIVLYMPFEKEKKECSIMNLSNEYIKQINLAIYKFFNFTLLWGISRLSSSEYTVHQCYEEAFTMLKTQPSKVKKIFQNATVSKSVHLSISMEKKLLSAVSDLNTALVNQCLDEIFQNIEPTDKLDLLCNDLTSIAAKCCDEFKIPSMEDFPLLTSSYVLEKCLLWAKNLFQHIVDTQLSSKSMRESSEYAHKAMSYIAQNYQNSTLSLGEIARHIGITEQYLSKIFKRETNKNISQYLSEYRIERAKELIHTKNISLKYLYSKVGFNDNSYFCTVFKKHAGCSPKEYLKKIYKDN